MKTKSRSISVIIAAVLMICIFTAAGALASEKDEAVQKVNEAITFYKNNGKDKTLVEVTKPNGKFANNPYVFIYDMNAVILAHPKFPKLIGKDMRGIADYQGKYFRKDMAEAMKNQNDGWFEYSYMNPDTKKVELKTTYVKKADNMLFACGVYR